MWRAHCPLARWIQGRDKVAILRQSRQRDAYDTSLSQRSLSGGSEVRTFSNLKGNLKERDYECSLHRILGDMCPLLT